MPDGLDPADAVAKDESIWKSAVENAVNIVDYFLESAKEEKDQKASDAILKEKILPLIKSIESNITQSRFIQKVSFATGIAENALWEELSKIKEEDAGAEMPKAKSAKESTGVVRAAGFLLWLKSLGNGYAEEFEGNLNRIDPSASVDTLATKENKDSLLFEAEMHYGGEVNLKQVGENILKHLEEEILKRDLAKAMERLKKAEAMHDAPAVDLELALCQKLSEKLKSLSKP